MTQPSIQLDPTVDVDLRVGMKDDVPFIVKAWLSTQRHIYPNSYALDWAEKKAAEILERIDRSTVLVANLAEHPTTILSYLVCQAWRGECIVLFAYTDEGARRQGIVRRLLEMANPEKRGVVFLHAPRNENVMRHIIKKWIFEPSLWSQT